MNPRQARSARLPRRVLGAALGTAAYVAPRVTTVAPRRAFAASPFQVGCAPPYAQLGAFRFDADALATPHVLCFVGFPSLGVPCLAILPAALPARLYVQQERGPLPAPNTWPDDATVYPLTRIISTGMSPAVVLWSSGDGDYSMALRGGTLAFDAPFVQGQWYRLTLRVPYQMPAVGADGELWLSVERFAL